MLTSHDRMMRELGFWKDGEDYLWYSSKFDATVLVEPADEGLGLSVFLGGEEVEHVDGSTRAVHRLIQTWDSYGRPTPGFHRFVPAKSKSVVAGVNPDYFDYVANPQDVPLGEVADPDSTAYRNFWVAPDGTLHTAAMYRHDEVLEMLGESWDPPGWLRLVTTDFGSGSLEGPDVGGSIKVTTAQTNALDRLRANAAATGDSTDGRWAQWLAAELDMIYDAGGYIVPEWLDNPGETLEVTNMEGRPGNNRHLTRRTEGLVPPEMLLDLPGARGEEETFIYDEATGTYTIDQSSRHGVRYTPARWAKLVANMRDEGFDPSNPIFIIKDFGQAAKIQEGNHRLRAAHEAGLDLVPVEIRYFGHSEYQRLVLPTLEPRPPWREWDENP
jgi:hypothetical protein